MTSGDDVPHWPGGVRMFIANQVRDFYIKCHSVLACFEFHMCCHFLFCSDCRNSVGMNWCCVNRSTTALGSICDLNVQDEDCGLSYRML
jgi:hypothetical protein